MKKLLLFIMMVPVLLLVTACDEEVFTVTFVGHNGEVLHEVDAEGTIVPPTDPERPGYVFDGWYTDETYLDEYDEFDYNDVLIENLTVYAKWAPAVFTVTVHYGIGIESQEIDYTFGTDIGVEEPPVKKGYVLGDFYVNEANTVLFDPSNAPVDDFEVYASWIPKTVTVNYFEDIPFDVALFGLGRTDTQLVTTTGKVYTWGYTQSPTIGIGIDDNDYTTLPIDITDSFDLNEGESIIQISKQDHALALTSQHRVFGWGYTGFRQLGFESNQIQTIPKDLSDYMPLNEEDYVVSVSTGNMHSVLLTNEGHLIVSGNGELGQFGYEIIGWNPIPFTDVTEYVPLDEGETIAEAYAYDESTLLFTSLGRVLVTGLNHVGQLGTGDKEIRNEFVDITDSFSLDEDENIIDFAFGEFYVLVLTDKGDVYSFGDNGYGQCGTGNTLDILSPTMIVDGGSVDIQANGRISFYTDENGDLYLSGRIPYEFQNLVYGEIDTVLITPTLFLEGFLSEEGTNSHLTLGYDSFWVHVDGPGYMGYGDNNYDILLDYSNGSVLSWYFPTEYQLLHSEEVTYGEFYEVYIPEANVYKKLTKWYLEEEKEHRFFGGTNVTYEELNLYGVWETVLYSLTIYENNGTQGYVVSHTYDQEIHLYDSKRPGYVLEGWYADEELTVPFDITNMPDYNLNVYAKWEEATAIELVVPFEGTFTSLENEVLYSFTLTENQHFQLFGPYCRYYLMLLDENRNPIDDLEGFDYDYYDMDSYQLLMSEMLPAGTYYIYLSDSSSIISYDSRIALGDYFEPSMHTATLHFAGHLEQIRQMSGSVLQLPALHSNMMTFEGWYLDEACTIPFGLGYMPNEDIDLYPLFEQVPIHELTFDQVEYPGEIAQGESNYYSFTLTEETTVTMFTISSMDTYGLLYDSTWYQIQSNDDYQGLDFGFEVTLPAGTYYLEVRGLSSYEQGTFTLVFTDGEYIPPTYTITFETNGGTLIDPIELEVGAFIDIDLSVFPEKDGYVFAGFYMDEELTIPFEWGRMPAHDITMYVKWVEGQPIDLASLPITLNGTLDSKGFVAYTLTLSESQPLNISLSGNNEVYLGVFDLDMNDYGAIFIDSSEPGTLTLNLQAGEYNIIVLNQSSFENVGYEVTVETPETT